MLEGTELQTPGATTGEGLEAVQLLKPSPAVIPESLRFCSFQHPYGSMSTADGLSALRSVQRKC